VPLSPYVASLRARIGQDLLLLPSVTVLPVDDEGRLLLVRHRSTGIWGVVGGAVEPDEHPAVAAGREAREETGYEVTVGALIGNVGGPSYRVTYPNGDRAAYVSAVYEGTVVGGAPKPDGEEVVEVGWFSGEELMPLPMSELAVTLLREVGWLP
jgi:ADP-ribose pyrophosphatase YjhB (NUDIX family)